MQRRSRGERKKARPKLALVSQKEKLRKKWAAFNDEDEEEEEEEEEKDTKGEVDSDVKVKMEHVADAAENVHIKEEPED